MAIRLIIRDLGSILIAGDVARAKDILLRRRGVHTVKSIQNGHEYSIPGESVLAAEVIPDAEYEKKQREVQEAAEKAAAEAGKSPHPGREPVRVIPGGKR